MKFPNIYDTDNLIKYTLNKIKNYKNKNYKNKNINKYQ